MSDDLVKRLRMNPVPPVDTFALRQEAADRIEAQAAEIERLKRERAVVDDLLEQQVGLAFQYVLDCNEAVAEIERLREAGNKLAGYAGHDAECEDVTGAYPGSCSCGYTHAWQAWHNLAGKAEQ